MFEGVLTALVTPFRNGVLDEDALENLVELQIEAGVDGLVPCGSSGEAATLSHDEHRRVVELERIAPRLSLAAWARFYRDNLEQLEEHGVEAEIATTTDLPAHAE